MCNQCMLYSLTVLLHHMHIQHTLHSLYLMITFKGAVDAYKYTGGRELWHRNQTK